MKHFVLFALVALLLSGCRTQVAVDPSTYWPRTPCPHHNTQDTDDVCLITHPHQTMSVKTKLDVFASAVSADGSLVALGGIRADGALPTPVLLVDMKTGEVKDYESFSSTHGVAFNPDATLLATSTMRDQREPLVRVWTLTSPPTVRDLTAPTSHPNDIRPHFTSVIFTPDSRTLIAGRSSGEIVLWDAASGKRQRILTPRVWDKNLTSLDVSPDSTKLVTAARWSGPEATVYDLHSGSVQDSLDVSTLDSQNSWPQDVAISPDGSTVAIAANCRDQNCGGTVWLWDLATGRTRALHGHVGDALSVVFHPDGRWLASGGIDNTIRIWDWHTGREIYRMNAPVSHEMITGKPAPGVPAGAGGLGSSTQGLWSPVDKLSITAKGDLLVFSESANGQARVWRLPERLWR